VNAETKPRFITELWAARDYSRDENFRANWRLIRPLIFESAIRGVIEVPAGFVTDFASVPRLPIAFWLFGDTAHAPAVIHDYLVRVEYPQCKIEWTQAADVFEEAMKAQGVGLLKRKIMAHAVRAHRKTRNEFPDIAQ
jgi:hypothetical protein